MEIYIYISCYSLQSTLFRLAAYLHHGHLTNRAINAHHPISYAYD